tara:strand:+ start:3004 stop:3126 length:123 start_codon:yes stop_codon:yes gene_type:complete
MEILWVTGGIFVLIVGITKFAEHINRKEAYERAEKIARGK